MFCCRTDHRAGLLLADSDGVVVLRVIEIFGNEFLEGRDLLQRRLADLRLGGRGEAAVADVAGVAGLAGVAGVSGSGNCTPDRFPS